MAYNQEFVDLCRLSSKEPQGVNMVYVWEFVTFFSIEDKSYWPLTM